MPTDLIGSARFRAWVRSLVGGLRSHKQRCLKKHNKTQSSRPGPDSACAHLQGLQGSCLGGFSGAGQRPEGARLPPGGEVTGRGAWPPPGPTGAWPRAVRAQLCSGASVSRSATTSGSRAGAGAGTGRAWLLVASPGPATSVPWGSASPAGGWGSVAVRDSAGIQ